MESRELVKRTLEFDFPQRVPRDLWILPWAVNHYRDSLEKLSANYPDDITAPRDFLKKKLDKTGNPHEIGVYVDEWGCVWQNKQAGVIGEVKEPILADWSHMDRLRIPVERLSVDREKVNAFCASTQQFVLSGVCQRPFERLQFLRGTENVMMDLAVESSEVMELLDRIHRFNLEELSVWAGTDVDGLFIMDDWGSQNALLISPDMWRKLFKPIYQQYIDLAHAHGKYIFMHSDGYIFDIIEDLIELGLDALNSQIFCMGLEKLSTAYRGRICFWGEIDRQHILPEARSEEVHQAVRQVCQNLYANGGVIAQCEFGPGAKPENVMAVFEAWDKIEIY